MEHIEFRTVEQDLGDSGPTPRDRPVPQRRSPADPDSQGRAARRAPGGNPDLAGAYAGLAEDSVRWPSRHYLGEPVFYAFGDGDGISTTTSRCICCGTSWPGHCRGMKPSTLDPLETQDLGVGAVQDDDEVGSLTAALLHRCYGAA